MDPTQVPHDRRQVHREVRPRDVRIVLAQAVRPVHHVWRPGRLVERLEAGDNRVPSAPGVEVIVGGRAVDDAGGEEVRRDRLHSAGRHRQQALGLAELIRPLFVNHDIRRELDDLLLDDRGQVRGHQAFTRRVDGFEPEVEAAALGPLVQVVADVVGEGQRKRWMVDRG